MSSITAILDRQHPPLVGEGPTGCQRSAQVCRDEAWTLPLDDPRRVELLGQAAAWELRAFSEPT